MKLLVALLATASVVLLSLWFVEVSVRIENAELRLEQAELHYQKTLIQLTRFLSAHSSRQSHLENSFRDTESFRLTLEHVKAYNSEMKTHFVSTSRHKNPAIGGG